MRKLMLLFSLFLYQSLMAQNVGIGTTTPQSRLHIASTTDEVLRLDANAPYVSLYSNGTYKGYFWKSPNSIEIGSAATTNLPVTLAPDGVQRFYVGADGNVGIGTLTPTQKLDIDGTIRIRQGNPGQGKVLVSDATGTASWAALNSSTGGSVGFGTWGDCSMNNITDYNPVWDEDGDVAGTFGQSVAMDGTFAIIGAFGPGNGSAHIFQYNGSNWVFMQKLTDPDGTNTDGFGMSVAIDGNFAFVGSFMDNVGSNIRQGSVSIYQLSGGTWSFLQKITRADGAPDDHFGASISASGNFLAVGTPEDNVTFTDQGSVSLYQYNGSNWVIAQTIVDIAPFNGYLFGFSVSLSGNNLLVGSPEGDNGLQEVGWASYFQYNGSTWVFKQQINNPTITAFTHFGKSVSISGNYAVMGCPNDIVSAGNAGSASIYKFNGTSWVFIQAVSDPTSVPGEAFGNSVFISGNHIIIGGMNDQVNSNPDQGSAFIYQRVGGGWQRLQIVTDPAGNTGDYFGFAVVMDETTGAFLSSSIGYMNYTGKAIFGKIR